MAYQKFRHPLPVPHLRNVMLLRQSFLHTGCGSWELISQEAGN